MSENPPIREHPAAQAFVSVAQRFCTLLEFPVHDRDLWLADLLSTLATLYAAASTLREVALPEEGAEIPTIYKLKNEEWNALYLHLQAILGRDARYSAHFNPLTTDPAHDEPTAGDLADDLADIYRDIKPGLSAWNTLDDAYLHDIFYQWLEMGYRHHWGRHAADAIRMLHWLVYR